MKQSFESHQGHLCLMAELIVNFMCMGVPYNREIQVLDAFCAMLSTETFAYIITFHLPSYLLN